MGYGEIFVTANKANTDCVIFTQSYYKNKRSKTLFQNINNDISFFAFINFYCIR